MLESSAFCFECTIHRNDLLAGTTNITVYGIYYTIRLVNFLTEDHDNSWYLTILGTLWPLTLSSRCREAFACTSRSNE